MLDSHCHLDRFDDPIDVMRTSEARGAFIVAVTNLPSHFVAGRTHVAPYRRVRLAVGLHPLSARDHERERPLFEKLLRETSFVGEVGLDFSREGRSTQEIQRTTFRFVCSLLSTTSKFVTLHSRGAEAEVLATLREFEVPSAVFHWYTGPLDVLHRILGAGYMCSVNPSMAATANGRRILEALPPDRVLTESDGPYARVAGRVCRPWDVDAIEKHLARVWGMTTEDVRTIVWANFKRLVATMGNGEGRPTIA